MLKEWRTVVDKYAKDFGASVFHEDGIYLDLIDNMPTDTWQVGSSPLSSIFDCSQSWVPLSVWAWSASSS